MENNLNPQTIIRSKLVKDDYVKANKVIIKMMKAEKKWIAYIITFLLLVILGVKSFFESNKSDTVEQYAHSNQIIAVPWYIAYLPTIFLFVILIAATFIIKYGKKAPIRYYESNKLIQEEMEFTFNDIGIECKSDRVFSKINWNEVYKVYISRNFFFIFISNRTFWIIPKKNADYTDVSNLINTFKTNLVKKKVKITKY
jgi:hypothetical protein